MNTYSIKVDGQRLSYVNAADMTTAVDAVREDLDCGSDVIVHAYCITRRPYSLPLSRDERNAIDWIGGRYWNGDNLKTYLTAPETVVSRPDDGEDITDRFEWADDDGLVIFHLTEAQVWSLREGWEDEGSVCPCFDDALADKITHFFLSVV